MCTRDASDAVSLNLRTFPRMKPTHQCPLQSKHTSLGPLVHFQRSPPLHRTPCPFTIPGSGPPRILLTRRTSAFAQSPPEAVGTAYSLQRELQQKYVLINLTICACNEKILACRDRDSPLVVREDLRAVPFNICTRSLLHRVAVPRSPQAARTLLYQFARPSSYRLASPPSHPRRH